MITMMIILAACLVVLIAAVVATFSGCRTCGGVGVIGDSSIVSLPIRCPDCDDHRWVKK